VMNRLLTRQYASLIAVALAGLAILGALWIAARSSPTDVTGSALSAGQPPASTPEGADRWQTRPVRLVGGYLTASRNSDEPAFPAAGVTVNLHELYDLPPAKDEIAALQEIDISVVTAAAATSLSDDDIIFGVQLYGHRRCYPRNILARHCLVNDRLSEEPVLMYFDPPSGACMAFIRPSDTDGPYHFAVSGLAYNGMGLPYDRQTRSLWYPLSGKAVVGAKADKPVQLKRIVGDVMTWAAWRELWPDTTVLAPDTGYQHDYSTDPYTRMQERDGQTVNYYESDLLLAPDALSDTTGTMADKAEVLGVTLPAGALAVPVAEAFAAATDEPHTFSRESRFGTLHLEVDAQARRIHLTMPGNVRPPQVRLFWYAWRAAYPETIIWRMEDSPDE
jgi:hypothetical protein